MNATPSSGFFSNRASSYPSALPPASGHHHAVQFYENDSILLQGLSKTIASALVGGEAAVVIATKAHRSSPARELQSLGLDSSIAAREGRYIVLDAAETLSKFMADGLPHAGVFAQV